MRLNLLLKRDLYCLSKNTSMLLKRDIYCPSKESYNTCHIYCDEKRPRFMFKLGLDSPSKRTNNAIHILYAGRTRALILKVPLLCRCDSSFGLGGRSLAEAPKPKKKKKKKEKKKKKIDDCFYFLKPCTCSRVYVAQIHVDLSSQFSGFLPESSRRPWD